MNLKKLKKLQELYNHGTMSIQLWEDNSGAVELYMWVTGDRNDPNDFEYQDNQSIYPNGRPTPIDEDEPYPPMSESKILECLNKWRIHCATTPR